HLSPHHRLPFLLPCPASTCSYTLSLHDALPIWPTLPGEAAGEPDPAAPPGPARPARCAALQPRDWPRRPRHPPPPSPAREQKARSEEHTSELQSRENLVCRLLLEKKKRLNSHIL